MVVPRVDSSVELMADWWVASKAEMLAEKMVELMVEMSVVLMV